MKGKIRLNLSYLLMLFMFVVSFVIYHPLTSVAGKKVYRMKIQSAYPRGDLSMDLLKYFAESAAKRSDGQIKIQVFADPELVPAEQLFESTQRGTLDMLHAPAAMWGGVIPLSEVEFGLPFAYNIPGNKSIVESGAKVREFFLKSGFADLLRKEYAKHDLYWLDMHSYGGLVTMSTTSIVNCKDLQGKKFRVEGSWAKYYDMLGARGIFIPGTDAYMGLKLGTIDASQWDISAITGLKWYEVAPYWLKGGQNDVVPGQILFNLKRWNSLPADIQKALAGAAEDYYHKLLDVYVGEMDKAYKLVKSGKIKVCQLSEACEKKHEAAAYKLWDEIGKRDPVAAQGIQMIKDWRKTLK